MTLKPRCSVEVFSFESIPMMNLYGGQPPHARMTEHADRRDMCHRKIKNLFTVGKPRIPEPLRTLN